MRGDLVGAVIEKMRNLGAGAPGVVDGLRRVSGEAADEAAATVGQASSAVQGVLSNQEARDKLLLDAAGVAIAAAVGLAYLRSDGTYQICAAEGVLQAYNSVRSRRRWVDLHAIAAADTRNHSRRAVLI